MRLEIHLELGQRDFSNPADDEFVVADATTVIRNIIAEIRRTKGFVTSGDVETPSGAPATWLLGGQAEH
jgi:hypothetical protein